MTKAKTSKVALPQEAPPTTAAKKAAKKTAKKAAKKSAKPANSAGNSAEKTARAPKAMLTPSADAVSQAAYLNYRRRVELGLPGDSHSDWLEAERQIGVPI